MKHRPMPESDRPAAAIDTSGITGDPVNRALWLRDGRRLGFAEYGDPDGTPALFFHGEPGSRLTGALLADHASAAGVRLIAPDRPGCGLSSFQQVRGLRTGLRPRDPPHPPWPRDPDRAPEARDID